MVCSDRLIALLMADKPSRKKQGAFATNSETCQFIRLGDNGVVSFSLARGLCIRLDNRAIVFYKF